MTPHHSAGKEETVSERAVRGYFAGYVYGERAVKILPDVADGGVIAYVTIGIPPSSVKEMLRREKANKKKLKKKKKPAKRVERFMDDHDGGGYVG